MKLTTNFSKSEFDSKDGAEMPMGVLSNVKILAKQLQTLRDEVKRPIQINSGYRSPAHNKKVGGVSNSQHVKGTASDIAISGLSPKKVADIIESLISQGKMLQGGIGIYNTFTHYDIRGTKARWDFRK